MKTETKHKINMFMSKNAGIHIRVANYNITSVFPVSIGFRALWVLD